MKVNIGPYSAFDENRVIDVHIDDYDVWNMDVTLSYIIVPMLERLKEVKQGAPFVEDEDVPANLRANMAVPSEHGHVDSNWFARWDYVLDEMIWAFKQLSCQLESAVFDGKRISNGFMLFGKYYRNLWD